MKERKQVSREKRKKGEQKRGGGTGASLKKEGSSPMASKKEGEKRRDNVKRKTRKHPLVILPEGKPPSRFEKKKSADRVGVFYKKERKGERRGEDCGDRVGGK